ncbi:unnamed protein product [Schistosoma rodhaini]|uniref:OB domain-containing protein n=1 Tax=Schistosoma rodhaini TaxID=6188 RepID=A0AA85G7T9_9TREM|nr:unnamed protein product [Schistosoma rodhaini]
MWDTKDNKYHQYDNRVLSQLGFGTPNLTLSFLSLIPKASVSSLPAFVYKSHACGELSTQHINSTVTVCGWPGHCRLSSRFLVLRDDRGSIQIYCDKNSLQIPQFNSESVLIVTGKVQARPEKDVNKLDIEMAFITPDDIYEIIEKMLLYIWPTVQSTSGYQTISIAFLRMEYCDAMS